MKIMNDFLIKITKNRHSKNLRGGKHVRRKEVCYEVIDFSYRDDKISITLPFYLTIDLIPLSKPTTKYYSYPKLTYHHKKIA